MEPRWVVPVAWRMFIAIAICAVVMPAVFAAPRAETQRECMVAADMLVVAIAAHRTGVNDRRTRELMLRIYGPERHEKWTDVLIRHAVLVEGDDAKLVGQDFYQRCHGAKGRLDGILGVAL